MSAAMKNGKISQIHLGKWENWTSMSRNSRKNASPFGRRTKEHAEYKYWFYDLGCKAHEGETYFPLRYSLRSTSHELSGKRKTLSCEVRTRERVNKFIGRSNIIYIYISASRCGLLNLHSRCERRTLPQSNGCKCSKRNVALVHRISRSEISAGRWASNLIYSKYAGNWRMMMDNGIQL